MSRAARLLPAVGLLVLVGIASADPREALPVQDLLVGLWLLGGGTLLVARSAGGRLGPLLLAAGTCWLLGDVLPVLVLLHRGPLVHALLSSPTGRLRDRWRRAVVACVYLDGAVLAAGSDARLTLVVMIVTAAAAVWGWATAKGWRRRAALVPTLATVLLCVVMVLSSRAGSGGLELYEGVVVLASGSVLLDLLAGRWSQATVTGLVVDLGAGWESSSLRDRLARVLGDDSLVVGYWVPADARYVEESGSEIDLAPVGPDRVVTTVDGDGEPAAVLVHDRVALDDPVLLAQVSRAVRVVVDAVRLQALLRSQALQLAASRQRIVAVAQEQRAQLARELETGAGRRLALVEQHLSRLAAQDHPATARERMDAVLEHVASARAQVFSLAGGIRPGALTDGGLGAALGELAALSPVPVQLDVERLACAPDVEAAVYFVCSEALANVIKHAGASSVAVVVCQARGRVRVTVADDGRGGADPAAGSGLSGLAARLALLGGDLHVTSRPGAGTTVTAELPIGGDL